MDKLMPRQAVPPLKVERVGGAPWELTASKAERFTMLVFYRGFHCPVCRGYLAELNRLIDDFVSRGLEVIAMSSDTQERALESREAWKLDRLDLGYGLDLDVARAWGLYISSSRGKTSLGIEEPERFSEPGVFLVRPDNTLYWGAVQTMPFARPNFKEMLAGLDFIIKNDYPARGEA